MNADGKRIGKLDVDGHINLESEVTLREDRREAGDGNNTTDADPDKKTS